MGVASYPGEATDRDGLVLAADRACYAAKAAGRGQVATVADAERLHRLSGDGTHPRASTVAGVGVTH